MNKILPLLAIVLSVAPVNAGFVLPEEETNKEYNTSNLEWDGCYVPNEKDFTLWYPTVQEKKCLKHYELKPSSVKFRWKNARKCEEYTDGCVELDGVLYVDGKRYELANARTRYRIRSTSFLTMSRSAYQEIFVQPTTKEYQPMKFNCRASISEIRYNGPYTHDERGYLYKTTQFHEDVCNSVFPEPKKDAAYHLKRIACTLQKDMEKKEECNENFAKWWRLERWK